MTRFRLSVASLLPDRLGPRLALLLVMSAGLSAALAMLVMLVTAWIGTEGHARTESRQVADTLAYSVAAPLAFDDAAGIREALSTLSARPDIRAAWLRDADGRLVQAYGKGLNSAAGIDGGGLWQKQLVVSAPVLAGNGQDRIGSVTLRVDLSQTLRDLRHQTIVAGLAALSALLVAVVLSQRLARRISVPIVQLAAAARAMTDDWRTRKPLSVTGDGEIAVAINAFNHMVEELERRDTDLQKLNAELRKSVQAAEAARQQAETASQAKTRFLANMSHELRSPLNGVIGAAQLLEATGENAARRAELVRIIRTSGNNLLDMIENVLDVARIEAGRVQIDRRPFDLVEAVESALAPAVALASVRGLRLSCWIDPAVPRWCEGDAKRVRQLVQNLLGNAVKFTERGRITVDVRNHADTGRVSIAVTDTGIGMTQTQLQSAFEPFRQADPSATRRYGGSGLGLAICRDVARLMGGDVRAKSEPGSGSTFTLSLPLPAVPAVVPVAPPDPPPLVLCIEPDMDQRRAVTALLLRLGCTPRHARDAATMRQALRGCADAGTLVVLLAMDHPEAAELAAIARELRPATIVLGIGVATGTGMVSGTLTRPVMLSALEAALKGAIENSDTSMTGYYRMEDGTGNIHKALQGTGLHRSLAAGRSGEPAEFPAPRVLVVEDDQVNQIIVRSMAEQGGFACTIAGCGADALRRLSVERFDAVLMDWQMPDMDGIEVTRRLRAGLAGELNRAVPVIALTANAFAEDRDTCMGAGMNDFLSKPVQGATLIAALQRWCRAAGAMQGTDIFRMPDSVGSGAVRVAAPACSDAGEATEAVFDRQVLARLPMVADGSRPESVRELLSLFISTARARIEELSRSMASSNANGMQRTVHTLKSSAGQIGACALSAVAASAEQGLRAGEAPDPSLVIRLRQELQRFEAACAADCAAPA